MPALHAAETLTETADRLAAFDSSDGAVLSLYLDTRANEHGRDHWQPFVRKELPAGADGRRILAWLESELLPSSNGAAVFAGEAAGLFEALQFDAPFSENVVHVGPEPRVYPLLRLIDRNPRFAVLLTDTNHARLLVFGLGQPTETLAVESEKLTRTQQGGWAQQRYQRHVDDHHRQHAKAAVQALEQAVRAREIAHVLLAGDEVVLPLLRDELSQELSGKVLGTLPLQMETGESEIRRACGEALAVAQASAVTSKIARIVDRDAAHGLAVTGLAETRKALARGQVSELLITAQPDALADEPDPARRAQTAERLVKLARRTSAAVTFADEPALSPLGGVGALLRYRTEGA